MNNVNNFKVVYPFPPVQEHVVPFAYWDDAFNENELNWLQSQTAAAKVTAGVGRENETGVNKDLRRTLVDWLPYDVTTEWVFAKLAYVAQSLNSQYFRLDLTGFTESIQMTNYLSGDKGMYGWHVDYGTFISRKLSMILQLSDPLSYEGGDLQLNSTGGLINIEKKRGRIIVFPSYCLHQVTPVTSGTRQTLVAWISGPAFK